MDAGGGPKEHTTAVLDVHPMRRASEKNVIEAVLGRRPGVEQVEANPVAQTATVTYDPRVTSLAELRRWVQECGYHCAGQSVPEHICDPAMEPDPAHDGHGESGAAGLAPAPPPAATPALPAGHAEHVPPAGHAGHAPPAGEAVRSPEEVMGHGGHGGMSMEGMVRDMRNRFLVAAIFSIPILLWSPIGRDVLGFTVAAPFGLRDDVWLLLLSLPVIFYSCWIFFDGAVRALRARTLDMMVLVAVAIGAGWLYSLYVTLTGGGDTFYEAATVLAAFVLLGHWFEMRARGGANDAIRTLLDLAPPKATVIRDGETLEVPTAEVQNKNGTLRVRATKVGADTALAQIVKLVQEAQNSKAPGQRLADRAAFWLVLVALLGGGGTLVTWLGVGRPLSDAILFAITVVVITCPDALGLATPTAIMVGTGLGAKRGILFKNAMALETSARIQAVVMDKTGTLTKGEPEVTDVITADGVTEAELLRLAAAVERDSEHPLAEAIVRRAEAAKIATAVAEAFENVPGHGAVASVDGRRVAVGNRRLMDRQGVELGPLAARREELAAGGRTAVIVAVDGHAAGLVGIADAPRETAAAAVAALREAGVEVVMLTGDNQATAERIAQQLGVRTVIAEVLRGDKASKIAELQHSGKTVAMVGDGVNDAPALAQADMGIAIGAGTDVAIETADVVLMRSDPLDVPVALQIGRGTLRKMRQNLGWAIGYNTIALPIAAGVFEPAFGLVLRPEIAALSMSGSSFIVAVNALALRRLRLPTAVPVSAEQPSQAPGSQPPGIAAPRPQVPTAPERRS